MRRGTLTFIFGISSGLFIAPAFGQDFPNKPIRVVVANSAGTAVDLLPRAMAAEMTTFLGQPIVVENRPGGGGIVGYEYVAKQAPADGYTVSAALVQGLASLPVTAKDLRFDPLKELPAVTEIAEGRYLFGSASSQPWKTLRELAAHARANPGKLNYGSVSLSAKLLTEIFVRDQNLNVASISYTGGGPYYQALVSGDLHMGFFIESQALAFGDKVRILATSGEKRLASLPDVPTFAELGMPQMQGVTYSLNVRSGTPRAAIDKLNQAAGRALQRPEVRAQFVKLYLEPVHQTPEVANRRLAEAGKVFADIANKIGLKPE